MIKNYTINEYAEKAVEANSSNKQLYILVTPTEFEKENPIYDENGELISTEIEKYTKDVATLIIAEPNYYICYQDNYTYGEINENLETEKAEKEAARIAMLNLTGADVERAIYKARGMDFDDIISYLEAQPLAEDGQPVVDIKALKIELKANNFYRGNPYVQKIGEILGFTDKQLTKFFETNDYTKLIESEV